MAIPGKKTKKIQVNDMTFRWKVSEQEPVVQLDDYWMGTTLAVSSAAKNGTTLLVQLRSKTLGQLQITPKMIVTCIQLALEIGWQPTTPGRPKLIPFSEIQGLIEFRQDKS